jgi:hypothetical protein
MAPEGALIIKKPPLLNCRLLCLVPTHRGFAHIFPWRPAIARVLREKRFAACIMMAADVALCWLHAPRRAASSFFSLHVHKKAFFPRPVPSSYLLAPGASTSEIRLLGMPAAGQTKELVHAESFFGGVLWESCWWSMMPGLS